MQPSPPILPQQPSQYDFIVNYGKNPSNNWLVRASLKTRLMVAGVGALILVLLVWVGFALLTGSTTGGLNNVLVLAQEQAELARISIDPAANATQSTTQNLAVTTELSLDSDQQAFVAYLTSAGSAPAAQQLAARRNKQSDATLTAAKAAGTYDQAYITLAQQELASYTADLKKAFNATSDQKQRQLLSTAYNHATLLVEMSQSD